MNVENIINKLKSIKISYVAVSGEKLCIVTEFRSCNRGRIVTRIANEKLVSGLTEKTVDVLIVCEEGLYLAQTDIENVRRDDEFTYIYLKTPDLMTRQQNREYFRVNAPFDCTITLIRDGKLCNYNVTTIDISAGGISCLLPENFKIEQNPKITIYLDKFITIEVEYKRTEVIGRFFKYSFKYVNISNKDRDMISQACIKKQLEMRRNALK